MNDPVPRQADKNPQISSLEAILAILGLLITLATGIVTIYATMEALPPQHPVRNMFIAALIGGIAAIMIGFFLVVLYNRFIKSRLAAVRTQPGRMYPLTRLHYPEYVSYINNVFKLSTELPLTLTFQEIFIEEPRMKLSTNLGGIPSTPITLQASPIESNPQTLDYFLTHEKLSQYNLVIVLGPPGIGKSALLQYIALTLINKKFDLRLLLPYSKTRRDFDLFYGKIPLLLSLPLITDEIHINPKTFTIADALKKNMEPDAASHIVNPNWINHHLRKGHCLVMFDKLDEVDSDRHDEVFQWIRRGMSISRGNRFLITSRPQNYGGKRKQGLRDLMVMTLEILSFNENDIRIFVQKMCEATVKRDPQYKTDPERLLQDLYKKPAIRELVRNPLLLGISVSTYIEGHPLPEKRVEFYERICDILLGKWDNDPRTEQFKSILQLVSYAQMQQKGQNVYIDIKDTKTLEHIENSIKGTNWEKIDYDKSNILEQFLQEMFIKGIIEQEGDKGTHLYRLFHSTVKEYLVALHLYETKNHQELISKIDKPEWKEIILLFCARGDASPIIDACLAKGALDLAFVCEKEASRITPEVRRKLDEQREMVTTETDPIRRSIIAQSRLEQRLRSMITLSKNTYISTEYISYCEYQIFLDEQQKLAKFYWPDHWSTSSLAIDRGKDAALGVRSSDLEAFCQALTIQDRDGWHYRPPTGDESARIERDSDLTTELKLVSNTGYFDDQHQFHWVTGTQINLQDIKDKVNNLLQQDRHLLTSANFPSILGNSLDDARTLNDMLIQRIGTDNTFKIMCTDSIENALNRIPAQALDLSKFVQPYPFGDSINRKYVHMPDTQFDQAQRLTQEIEKSLTFILSRKENISTDQAIKEKQAILRWSIRHYAWIVAHMVLYWSDHTSFAASGRLFENRRLPQQAQALYQQTLNYYLDLCISFALLELRIKGEVACWEGILLVRERS